MKRLRLEKVIVNFPIILGIFLLLSSLHVITPESFASQTVKKEANLLLAEVDNKETGASDAQAQKADTHQNENSYHLGTDKITETFYSSAQAAASIFKRISTIVSGGDEGSILWSDFVAQLSGGKGTPYIIKTVIALVSIITLGMILRWLFLYTTSDIRNRLINAVRSGKLQFLGRVLSRMLLDAMGVGIYILFTFSSFVLFFQEGNPNYVIISIFLVVSYYILLFDLGARIIFAPKAPPLRLFPMEDKDASFLYKWIILILLSAGFLAGVSAIFELLGVSRHIYLLVYSSAGVFIIFFLIFMIWQSRKRVAEAIASGSDSESDNRTLRKAFARNWHVWAILYVLVVGGIWVAKALNEEQVTVLNLIYSIFLIPIIIGVDQWVQRLLKVASGESREMIDLTGDENLESDRQKDTETKMGISHYVPLIRGFFRFFLVAFLFFVSLRLWGIDISIGRMFTRGALSIVLVVLISFIFWQIFKARIDQKLKEEMPDDDDEAEEGGAGGSRLGTLLVLLRKFVFAVMFVIVALIILASLGVNIGPLIAGAGVIGLAIGFGAQTLVKDIIAGVFFLIDDAFRVGDYIEVGGTKGTVEHISLRSLRLRSPKGPVHTIPFGDMGTVTNNSRDYIITKLDFRVGYDTNVDKVRKIIKKIYKKIAKDEEMGPNLLGKIKSQGVRELEDSAMIMRVKFKTIPGQQFVIRREVLRMIQEAFRESGIRFAHRNVTVYIPPENPSDTEDKDNKQEMLAGAAAALAADQAGEEKK